MGFLSRFKNKEKSPVTKKKEMTAEEYCDKGITYRCLGQFSEALSCYEKALEIDPKHVKAWNQKKDVFAELKKFNEAINCCEKILEIDPKNAEAWNDEGVYMGSLWGQSNRVLHCYDMAIEINPNYVEAWSNKAAALGSMGRFEETLRCCNMALRINPKYPGVLFNKALAENALDLRAAATQSFLTFLRFARGHVEFTKEINYALDWLRNSK